MFDSDFIQRALLALPVLLFSLTVHEFFHAYIAFRCGDSTAKDMGRLTLNPLAHLDVFGVLVMIMTQFRFGWAKPVPVNPYNLKNPRRDDLWISAAGPLSNFGLAIIFGLIFQVFFDIRVLMIQDTPIVASMLSNGVFINLALGFFNLIPLYPLDGSHILKSLLPVEFEPKLIAFQQISPFVLLGLIIIGGVWIIIGPIVRFFSLMLLG